MKNILKALSLAAILVVSSPFAFADTFAVGDIVLAGGGTFTFSNNNTVATFVETSNGDPTANTVVSANGAFAPFTTASASQIMFDNFSTTAPGSIFSITMGGNTLLFSATSYTGLTPATGSSGGAVTIDGIVTETVGSTVYTPTSGNLIFTENGRLVSFTEDALTTAPPAVPEPSSFILLGTGLLTAAGAARRRFKI